jgi:trehalose synthase
LGADVAVSPITGADARHYQQVTDENAAELLTQLRRDDIAILHDPQTAGLVEPLTKAGVRVLWRCHIGVDMHTDVTRAAWEFLQPYLAPADGYVFTRRQYAPSWMPPARVWVIPPSIDPFSAKNTDLPPDAVRAILAVAGVTREQPSAGRATFTRSDGTTGEVVRSAQVTGDGRPGPDDQVVVQVSRWDRLKDMAGVLRGFADYVLPHDDSYLMLAGPAVSGVADDPEGAEVFAECLDAWSDLPARARARVLLVTLPLDDVEENATMVNAIQRRAAVIVQKSIAEGFGLTVAEGMWKGRPVVGSAVGGIVDQIAEGTGILLADPTNLAEFGLQVRNLLDDPREAERMGKAGREYTRSCFLGDLHLLRFADVMRAMLADLPLQYRQRAVGATRPDSGRPCREDTPYGVGRLYRSISIDWSRRNAGLARTLRSMDDAESV